MTHNTKTLVRAAALAFLVLTAMGLLAATHNTLAPRGASFQSVV